jgi:hypothetical protein
MKKLQESTIPHEKKIVDPALLTFKEYYNIVNPKDKFHPSDAYSMDLKKLNSGTYGTRADYKPVKRITINNIKFEIGIRKEDNWQENTYRKYDEYYNTIMVNGEVQYYSIKELEQMGKERWSYDFAAFDMETSDMVSWVTDGEWGCLLIMTAEEYKGFGFGPILVKMLRNIKPAMPSGGFTSAGFQNFKKVHTEFVKDYIKTGMYSQLVKDKIITTQRAKEIINDTFPNGIPKPKPQSKNLSSNDPKDWLLFGDNGCFILYDKKLVDIYMDDNEFWTEKMIKGYIYVGGYTRDDWFHVKNLGGDSDKIKQYLLACGLSHCADENAEMVIDSEYYSYLPQNIKTIKQDSNSRKIVAGTKLINYQPLLNLEKKFRKTFDRYGEFHDRLIEIAEGKY